MSVIILLSIPNIHAVEKNKELGFILGQELDRDKKKVEFQYKFETKLSQIYLSGVVYSLEKAVFETVQKYPDIEVIDISIFAFVDVKIQMGNTYIPAEKSLYLGTIDLRPISLDTEVG